MSDAVNPYQSPEASAVPVKPLLVQGSLTETMMIYLKATSPWLRFIGILGFISSGFTALWGIIIFILFPATRTTWEQIPGFESIGSLSNTLSMVLGGTVGLFCIGAAVLMFFPSVFLYRCGNKIRVYLRTGADQDLETAFRNNKSFWKFAGIVCIIHLAFFPLLIIGGIIAGVAAAFS